MCAMTFEGTPYLVPHAPMTETAAAADGCPTMVEHAPNVVTLAAADGGLTSTANLAHLCRGHHTLKHHGGWKMRQAAHGLLHWKSPTGRSYVDRPPSKVRFETAAQPGCDPPGLENMPF